jgi:enamine deaminase RidA (YjgF/YER057c/UK114 family)
MTVEDQAMLDQTTLAAEAAATAAAASLGLLSRVLSDTSTLDDRARIAERFSYLSDVDDDMTY